MRPRTLDVTAHREKRRAGRASGLRAHAAWPADEPAPGPNARSAEKSARHALHYITMR
jgi:hypothetical protein